MAQPTFLRRKPTVVDGMVVNGTFGADTRLIFYEPGNGTRYTIIVTAMPPIMCNILSLPIGSALVSLPIKHVSFVVTPGSMLNYNDLHEEFEKYLTLADCAVLAELLGEALHCGYIPLPDVEQEMLSKD